MVKDALFNNNSHYVRNTLNTQTTQVSSIEHNEKSWHSVNWQLGCKSQTTQNKESQE